MIGRNWDDHAAHVVKVIVGTTTPEQTEHFVEWAFRVCSARTCPLLAQQMRRMYEHDPWSFAELYRRTR